MILLNKFEWNGKNGVDCRMGTGNEWRKCAPRAHLNCITSEATEFFLIAVCTVVDVARDANFYGPLDFTHYNVIVSKSMRSVSVVQMLARHVRKSVAQLELKGRWMLRFFDWFCIVLFPRPPFSTPLNHFSTIFRIRPSDARFLRTCSKLSMFSHHLCEPV